MNTRDGLDSWRTRLEELFAGLLFGSAALLVLSGAIAMCVRSPLFAV